MAAGTKLVCTFVTSDGSSETFTFNYAKPGATTANVKALMNTIIANGEIFAKVPVTAKDARTITTSENEYNLS